MAPATLTFMKMVSLSKGNGSVRLHPATQKAPCQLPHLKESFPGSSNGASSTQAGHAGNSTCTGYS